MYASLDSCTSIACLNWFTHSLTSRPSSMTVGDSKWPLCCLSSPLLPVLWHLLQLIVATTTPLFYIVHPLPFCGCLKLFACVFMMQHCGTISLQALLINLGQRMWNALRFFLDILNFIVLLLCSMSWICRTLTVSLINVEWIFNVNDNGIVQHFVYLHLIWFYVT